MDLKDTVAVVVHHKSYKTVGRAVRSLLDQGIEPLNIIVIDNSEQPECRNDLLGSLPPSVPSVVFTENKGYAAAVNEALKIYALRKGPPPEFFLVSTHETNPEKFAVSRMASALRNDPSAAVAGPTLISGDSGATFLWSTGGYLTSHTHLPRHHNHREPIGEATNQVPQYRHWLDGSFLLYRWADVAIDRMDERFFLYMEETDFHLQLGRRGRRVLWVPTATAWQSSNGIPPYYLARNMRLLFKKNEPRWRRAVIPFVLMRAMVAAVVRRQDFSVIRSLLRGLFEKLPPNSSDSATANVIIVNPLGAALAHYQRETESVLRAVGVLTSVLTAVEPSTSGRSRIGWIAEYGRLLIRAQRHISDVGRDQPSTILVLWPVLGYLDAPLIGVLTRGAHLIMHDPHPLVRAVGYSSTSRALASLFRARVALVALSKEAADDIVSDGSSLKVHTLAHPIFPTLDAKNIRAIPKPIIQVLGQYKPDRDLQMLREIGAALGQSAILKVDGRNWPNISGWSVHSRFVPEEELDDLIRDSSVIMIPYRRFYQSGIAFRALELGIPIVGPRSSNLAQVFGSNSSLLAGNDATEWLEAVRTAISDGPQIVATAATRWRARSEQEWSQWALSLPVKRPETPLPQRT